MQWDIANAFLMGCHAILSIAHALAAKILLTTKTPDWRGRNSKRLETTWITAVTALKITALKSIAHAIEKARLVEISVIVNNAKIKLYDNYYYYLWFIIIL